MRTKDSNENKGFGFVTFKNVDLASKAIEKLNESEFKVSKLSMPIMLLFLSHCF